MKIVHSPVTPESFSEAAQTVMESQGITFDHFLNGKLPDAFWTALGERINRTPKACRDYLKRYRTEILALIGQTFMPEPAPPEEEPASLEAPEEFKQLAKRNLTAARIALSFLEASLNLPEELQKRFRRMTKMPNFSSADAMMLGFYGIATEADKHHCRTWFRDRWGLELP